MTSDHDPGPRTADDHDLLDLVRTEAALVLGHDGPAEVGAGAAFLELGFDSLSAVKLRNRLAERTGLRLRSTLVFEFSTPRALAEHLRTRLGTPEPSRPAPVPEPPERPAPAMVPGSDGSLESLLWRAAKVGQAKEVMNVLAPLARLRPSFGSIFDLDEVPEPVRLARGAEGPALVCMASTVGKSGPSQYARFAHPFRDRRDVWALRQLGFRRGELVPAALHAMVEAHAASIERQVGDRAVVLLGQSSGGLMAHAVAAHLEELGRGPAGVVLIDTYGPDRRHVLARIDGDFGRMLMQRQQRAGTDDTGDTGDQWGDAWITAMLCYEQFDYRPGKLAAPVLLVRASEPMPGWPEDWQPDWPFDHESVEVPGNHFSMMEEHAAATALSIQDWLGAFRG